MSVTHPAPKELAIAHCATCSIARHVNQEDRVPPRYCPRCGMSVAIAIYRFDRYIAVGDTPPPPR